MIDSELQLLVEKISAKVFNKAFVHSAKHNHRLRTTGGRYMLACHSIEINPKVLKVHGMEELIGVIKHELCHYHLHIEGRGYKHRDVDFRNLLQQTSSPRFCKPLVKRQRKQAPIRVYECAACKLQYHRRRKMDVNKYRCGQCRGTIIEI